MTTGAKSATATSHRSEPETAKASARSECAAAPTTPRTESAASTSTQSGPAADDAFADAVIDWFETHGRHDLPWQADPSPYRVWVSEIMLQQTRVGTVIPYFRRFMKRFPHVAALAEAELDQVLHLWTGLGYYARARNLHKAARTIVAEHGGEFPDTVQELTRLSGVGRSTAGAVLALARGRPEPILDGNVKRVLARCFAVAGYPGNSGVQAELWALAERLVPRRTVAGGGDGARNRVAAYTQGMMDLGAGLCARANPDCPRCPLRNRCLARQRGEIDRYPAKKPGKILPVRSVTMFILQDRAGRVLLEKRPPNGVWGSLYSLPEIETSGGAAAMPDPRGSSVRIGFRVETSGRETEMPANAAQDAAARDAPPASNQLPDFLSRLFIADAARNRRRAGYRPDSRPRLADEAPVELPRIRHGFTHFQLDITPVRYRLAEPAPAAADSDRWLWYSIADPAEVGLAAPVRKLLATLAAVEQGDRESR